MIDYSVNTDAYKTQIQYKVIRQCQTLSPLQEMIDYSVSTDTYKTQIQVQSHQATTATTQRNDLLKCKTNTNINPNLSTNENENTGWSGNVGYCHHCNSTKK